MLPNRVDAPANERAIAVLRGLWLPQLVITGVPSWTGMRRALSAFRVIEARNDVVLPSPPASILGRNGAMFSPSTGRFPRRVRTCPVRR